MRLFPTPVRHVCMYVSYNTMSGGQCYGKFFLPCHSGADSVPAETPAVALSQMVTGE